MDKYIDSLNEEIKQYLKILSPEIPQWLSEYINTKQMQRLNEISISCGTNCTKVYKYQYDISVLTHSIAVSLIIWNFTKDKKQTLAGLFHDIATPAFKHCIDFMNGDSETQESTEEKTEQIIKNDKQIMDQLKKDNIKLEEVVDYHIYPIADNDLPKLSADRLEYTLSGGLCQTRVLNLKDIEKYYNNIVISTNEDGKCELAFKDEKICEEFIHKVSYLWPRWVEDEDRVCMQFIADIIKSMNKKGYIKLEDLYNKSEKEIISKIKNCKDKNIKEAFEQFQNATKDMVYKSDTPKDGIYLTSVKGKKRYINPLTIINNKTYRIKDVSLQVSKDIDNFLNMKQHKYIGFEFEFKPY